MVRYIPWWLPMLLIAILNGVIREAWIKKHMSLPAAHQVSTGLLIVLFTVYMAVLFRKLRLESASEAIAVGIMWTLMTLIFEFGFGRWRGNSWDTLFAEYNILKGRIWILVPLWISIAPYLFYKYYSER